MTVIFSFGNQMQFYSPFPNLAAYIICNTRQVIYWNLLSVHLEIQKKKQNKNIISWRQQHNAQVISMLNAKLYTANKP